MPRGSVTQTRTFNYSSSTHLLTSETHPETGTTQYSYSPDSFTFDKLASKTDAKGQVTVYSYDAYYRVTEIQRYPGGIQMFQGQPAGEDICQRVTNYYDSYTDTMPNANAIWGAYGYLAAVALGDPSCTAPGWQTQQQFIEAYGYTPSGRISQRHLELNQPNGIQGNPGVWVWASWDVSFAYNQMGQIEQTTYPAYLGANNVITPGVKYTVGFDSMMRPYSLTDSSGNAIVSSVTYNAANQPLQTSVGATSLETRGYNVLNQVTSINGISYNYPAAGLNNGQISSSTVNSTTTSYAYDALKRLSSTTVNGTLSQSYTYDGFGNMTSKQGAGLNFTNTVNQNTNQLAGYCYDADGNMLGASCATPSYAYDVANRMVSAQTSSGGTEYYQYGADNKRIAKAAGTGEAIYMYGAHGEKLWAGGFAGGTNYVYFNGKLLGQNANPQGTYPYYNFPYVSVDRLGSVGSGYLPYGEQASPPASDDQVQFATYTRDANTGLDYADQRFYTSQFGRFMSADRFKRKFGANESGKSMSGAGSLAADGFGKVPDDNSSGGWNKYVYMLGDPVNGNDPTGQSSFCTDDDCDESEDPGDTVCDSNGSNCYDSVTVNGDEDGGGGNSGATTGQTWGQFGQAAGSCAASSFGIGTAAAGAAVGSGMNWLGTAGKFAGATRGTSLASGTLSTLFPRVIGATWAPTLNNPLATSTVLGRVVGRWIPVLGEIIQGAQFVNCLWASDDY
jgi:RHS repeat-associated protein